MDKNIVEIRGTVSKIKTNEHPYHHTKIIVSVGVPGKKDIRNYPTIVCFGKNKAEAANFKKGDKITVTGYVQNIKKDFRSMDENGKIVKKTQKTQVIIATDIQRTKRILEDTFGVVKGQFYPDSNSVAVEGSILGVYKRNDGLVDIIIRSIVNEKPSTVKVTYYVPNNRADAFIEKAKKDMRICAVGTVQTDFSKKENGDVIKFENLIIRHIHIGNIEDKIPEVNDNIVITEEFSDIKDETEVVNAYSENNDTVGTDETVTVSSDTNKISLF